MNEIAAVLLYVMSVETDAETDAFWCFSEMMAEPRLSSEVLDRLVCRERLHKTSLQWPGDAALFGLFPSG